MAQPVTRARIPDGYRDKLLSYADALLEVADDLLSARHDRRDPATAIIHANMDGERIIRRVENELRELRR